MGKDLDKLIFKDKGKKRQNWQEDCVEKAAKKFSDLITDDIKEDDEFMSVHSAGGPPPFTIDERLSRNIASIFGEAVDVCKKAGKTTYNAWLKGDKKRHVGFKQSGGSGALRVYLCTIRDEPFEKCHNRIPIQKVTKSLETNKDFIKHLDFNKDILDIEAIKADYKKNWPNEQKKAKLWTKIRAHSTDYDDRVKSA